MKILFNFSAGEGSIIMLSTVNAVHNFLFIENTLNQGFPTGYLYICLSEGVHLRLTGWELVYI